MSRHPTTEHLLRLFQNDHLPDHLREVSQPCRELAELMAEELEDGPELSAGLRKLREAKDCFVTQRVIDTEDKS